NAAADRNGAPGVVEVVVPSCHTGLELIDQPACLDERREVPLVSARGHIVQRDIPAESTPEAYGNIVESTVLEVFLLLIAGTEVKVVRGKDLDARPKRQVKVRIAQVEAECRLDCPVGDRCLDVAVVAVD